MISKKRPDKNNKIKTQKKFCQKIKIKIPQNEMKIKKEKKTFHWSNISGLSKRPVDLQNLITRLRMTLFKVFGLLVEPYNR